MSDQHHDWLTSEVRAHGRAISELRDRADARQEWLHDQLRELAISVASLREQIAAQNKVARVVWAVLTFTLGLAIGFLGR